MKSRTVFCLHGRTPLCLKSRSSSIPPVKIEEGVFPGPPDEPVPADQVKGELVRAADTGATLRLEHTQVLADEHSVVIVDDVYFFSGVQWNG
jgi:hypothetical protein